MSSLKESLTIAALDRSKERIVDLEEQLRQATAVLDRVMQSDPYNTAQFDDGMPGSDYKAETWRMLDAVLHQGARQ